MTTQYDALLDGLYSKLDEVIRESLADDNPSEVKAKLIEQSKQLLTQIDLVRNRGPLNPGAKPFTKQPSRVDTE